MPQSRTTRATRQQAPRDAPDAHVGAFRYRPCDDRWWSDEVCRMFGYEPGSMPATTDVLHDHADPEDSGRILGMLREAMAGRGPRSCYLRIVDAAGRTRHVVVVLDARLTRERRVGELHGYVVDVSGPRARDIAHEVTQAVRGATEHRAIIEQAKGMIMLAYGVGADTAFSILASRSQRHNVKVRDLASAVVGSGHDLPRSPGLRQRMLTHVLEKAPSAGGSARCEDRSRSS